MARNFPRGWSSKAKHCGQWHLWLTTPFPSSSPNTPTPKPHTLLRSPGAWCFPSPWRMFCRIIFYTALVMSMPHSLFAFYSQASRRFQTGGNPRHECRIYTQGTENEVVGPESAFSATSSGSFVLNVSSVSQYLVFLMSM